MWIQENRNGKLQAVERYTDIITGKKKTVSVTIPKDTARNRKLAEIALLEKIKTAQDVTVSCDHLRLSELLQEYLTYQQKAVKSSTYVRNKFALGTIVDYLGPDTLVNKLTANFIRKRFIQSGDSPNTLNERLTRFKAMIRWGYKNDYISDVRFLDKLDPFTGGLTKREKLQNKYLESADLEQLLDAMAVERWKLFTQFLVLSGLRNGEAIALLKSDVDLTDRVIHVTKTFDPVNTVATSPKTPSSVRDVFIQDELLEVCKQIKIFMLEDRLRHGRNASELFFEDSKGEHLKYYAYNKYLKETSIKVLGRSITPHTLRHTHASLLFEQGVPLDTVARRLGHEDSRITREIYLHITEKLKEKDNERIQNISLF